MMNDFLPRGGVLVCVCLLLVANCMQQADAQNCSVIQRQSTPGSNYLITRSPTADRCEQFMFGTGLYKGVHTIKIEGYIMDCSPNFPDRHNVLVFNSEMVLLHDYCKEARQNNTNTTSFSTTDYGLIVQQRSRKNNLVLTRVSYSFQFAPPPNASNSTNNSSTSNSTTTPALYGCGLAPAKPVVSTARVIGGQIAMNSVWPWMAFYGCGGVFISDRWVLTVAHCLFQAVNQTNQTMQSTNQTRPANYSDLTIFAGGNDLNNMPSRFNVRRVVLHQNFNPSTNRDDIALIQLDKPVVFSNNIQPICLPPYDLNRVDRKVILTGWGAVKVTTNNNVTNYTDTNVLQEVTIPMRSISECVSSLGINLDPSSQICAGVYSTNVSMIKSACQGDSGSPIVQQFGNEYYLAGLVSDGDASCNGNGYFTNVWFYRKWIRDTMEQQP